MKAVFDLSSYLTYTRLNALCRTSFGKKICEVHSCFNAEGTWMFEYSLGEVPLELDVPWPFAC